MELTPRPADRSTGAVDAADVGEMPDEISVRRYECTATEPNIAPLPFEERIDLETRVYAILLGVMSFGGVGWVCLCIGAALNLLS